MKTPNYIPVFEDRMGLILAALGQKRPVYVALVHSSGRLVGQSMEVIEQTYAESLAAIGAAVDDLQRRYAHGQFRANRQSDMSEPLQILVRTKPTRPTVAEDFSQVA